MNSKGFDSPIQVRVVNVRFPDSSFSGPAHVHVNVISNDRDVPIGLGYGIYVVEGWKEGALDENTERQYGQNIAAQVLKQLGLEGRFPACYVMCGPRRIYDSVDEDVQAVRLGPDEASMIFDLLSLAVEEEAKDFTAPSGIARAIQVVRKVMPVFCLPTDRGLSFAEATFEVMQERYTRSAGEDGEHFEDDNQYIAGDQP